MALTRKFKNGPYVYKGQQVDMYQLSRWIRNYNREKKSNLRPSTVTEKHIKQFLSAAESSIEELAEYEDSKINWDNF